MQKASLWAVSIVCLMMAATFGGCIEWFGESEKDQQGGVQATGKQYELERSDFFITMSDGVKIDCLRLTPIAPEEEIPENGWPAVIFIHGAGGSKNASMSNDPGFGSPPKNFTCSDIAKWGYVVLSYSVRGQGNSEGYGRVADPRQVEDVSEIMTWLCNNPAVDKNNIACLGGSQGGCTTWMAAINDDRFKTVVPIAAAVDFYQMTHPQGCVHITDDPTGVLKLTMYAVFVSAVEAAGHSMNETQMAELAQEMTAGITETGLETVKEYYRARSPYENMDRIKCPVFVMGGWYDFIFTADHTIWLYQHLNTTKKMYIGGGYHFGDGSTEEDDFRNKVTMDWLDYWLKGIDNGVMDDPIVYSIPPYWPGTTSGEWIHKYSDVWPPESTKEIKFYLHADGTLSENAPAQDETTKTFVNTYATEGLAVDSIVGMVPVPNQIQPTLTSSLDTASYASDPLERDVELTGTAILDLNISSTGSEYNLAPMIWEVCEDGSVVFVMRGAYRVSDASAGETKYTSFSPFPFSHTFRKGSRIQVTISNVDFPLFMPCRMPSINTIYHDAARSSSITIPFVY